MGDRPVDRDLDADPLVGVITLREVRLTEQGYDYLGVYRGVERYPHGPWHGHLRRLYLATGFFRDGMTFEGYIRGHDYAEVRKRLMNLFIEATVVRAPMLKAAKGRFAPAVWRFRCV